MTFKIKCNQCGNLFSVDTEEAGLVKCRCPHCGAVVTCRLNDGDVRRTKARSVVPIFETDSNYAQVMQLPEVAVRIIEDAPEVVMNEEQSAHHATFDPPQEGEAERQSAAKLSFADRIAAFQARHKHGDLWVFFGFSIAFMLIVVIGFNLMAELAMTYATVSDWAFTEYVKLKNSVF